MKKLGSKFGFRGSYRIIKLMAKPNYIPVGLWMKMYHWGMLDKWIISISPVISNLIMLDDDKGLNLVLQHLAGTSGFSLEIDNASIGSGTTPPVDTDDDLETPELENIIRATVDVNTDNIVTEWFMTDDELADGTYTEFALKCGTQLFARSIIDPSHTKASNEDTLVEYTINAAN